MALWSMLISSSIVCVKISNVCAKLHIFKVDKVDVCNGKGLEVHQKSSGQEQTALF